MYIDRIDFTLAPETLTRAVNGFGSIAELMDLLPAISDGDRKRLSKMGLKNEALALQIIEVGRLNPNLISRGIDFEMIDRDIAARAQLNPLLIQSEWVSGRIKDARMLLGIDIYAAALSIYNSLRRNAQTASLRATVDQLAQGFARPSRKKPESTPEASDTGSL